MVLTAVLLAVYPHTFALDPSLDVSQYAHTAWKVSDSFAQGAIITSIAQTPDGYLWLGTLSGLLRFDGLRAAPWQPPPGQHLPSNWVMSLLSARDGTLWIGVRNGLVSWKDGKFTSHPELAGQYIFKLLEDGEGTIWVAGFGIGLANGKLCSIHQGNVRCYGDDGRIGRGIVNLYEDSKGNLWAGVIDGLWRWRPGPAKFYPLAGNPNGIRALGEDTDGTLLVGWKDGIYRFVDGKTKKYVLRGAAFRFRADTMFRDKDGGLWIGTQTQGLVHVHQRHADVYSLSDGLSGDSVGSNSLFQDGEANIWVVTNNGLDRFRDSAITTLAVKQGLSSLYVGSVLAASDGTVWLGTPNGLDRWNGGQITNYGIGRKLNDAPHSLYQDKDSRIWVSTFGGLGYLENGKFTPIKGVPGGNILSIVRARLGYLWVDNETQGLFRVSLQGEVLHIPWSALGHKDHASILTPDTHNGIWIGFFLGGIAYISADSQVRASYSAADGLGDGRVSGFHFDNDGALWISTEEGGLSRLKDGRITTLTGKNGLPCDTVHWAMEDDAHSFWLYTACGLVRIERSELDAWVIDQKRRIQSTVFDSSDGVRSLSTPGHYSPQVARTGDGRIWFLPWHGVSVVDPLHLPFNKLPPPVHIEQVIADHKTYGMASDSSGRVSLPPRLRDLQIDYTALSLVAPEKVLFRYKLEGWDRDWQDVGTRRQAFYNNLPPRNYIFRVMACNNRGVWNEAGASLDFSVAPAYYQTWWFRSLCVITLVGLLAGFYQLRLRQVAQHFNTRMEVRIAERTRIARDLHDTMLQSVQGVLLKLHAVTYMLPDRGAEAQKMLENVIEQARQAVTESRDTVEGLRLSTLPSNEIAKALGTFADELAADHPDDNRPEFRVQVEGTPRDLAPILRDEIYRIGCEALRNAFRHACATRIEVEINYDPRRFCLRVRDDGKGIDPEILKEGRAGHYGLASMQERGKGVGGKIAVWSEVDSGTEIELTIPASIAYVKSTVTQK